MTGPTKPAKRNAPRPDPAPDPPGRISEPDLHHHRRMVARLEEAAGLQRQSQQLAARAAKLIAAADVWAEELGELYHLGPDGQVLVDGTIVRPAPPV